MTANYHHGNLRDTLIVAAITQLAQQNDAALSLRELARTVGVSIAAVYRHFPSKEALLADVAAAGFAAMMAKWDQQLPPAGSLPAEQRFQLLGQLYIEFALNAPAHYRLMFEHQDVRQFPALQQAAQACFNYVLQTAGAAVREAGVDPRWERAAASAGWSLGHGYVMLLLSGRLAMAESGDDLSPALVPRFFQLPVEAFLQQERQP
ncbi:MULTISPECIES: TetR/AcrR family transcriptional regulator [unclassified Janthinobacterium]|uniref:TetR/AcrR family transcriptional regulator n=1 Tax=unclassified Janthinobacterium TaxID=2610881 RepID=UPI0016080508|nr:MULTISPECIES: TetR/AcrR family transcriptional regulator [unclassified Janthinobacterium]MBB5606975.1 AcrR family transcriptional regulator [Janthinobacterium sp. S3T4]MBB5612701.1 AcrR family transcriptional regulator [Janthinobacterium sp. S3M3]